MSQLVSFSPTAAAEYARSLAEYARSHFGDGRPDEANLVLAIERPGETVAEIRFTSELLVEWITLHGSLAVNASRLLDQALMTIAAEGSMCGSYISVDSDGDFVSTCKLDEVLAQLFELSTGDEKIRFGRIDDIIELAEFDVVDDDVFVTA